jgi:hypothetical protein
VSFRRMAYVVSKTVFKKIDDFRGCWRKYTVVVLYAVPRPRVASVTKATELLIFMVGSQALEGRLSPLSDVSMTGHLAQGAGDT